MGSYSGGKCDLWVYSAGKYDEPRLWATGCGCIGRLVSFGLNGTDLYCWLAT